jgi:ParB family chromosome partitioning protein
LPPAQGFATLAALPPDAKQRLFAWCIASCLKPQLAIDDRADPLIECAGARLAIPFADYWRPTAANYWGRVKKAHSLGVGSEILGDRWARDHADDKKPVLAAALENAFDPAVSANCIGLDQAVRDSAAAWRPPGMTYDDGNGDLAHPVSAGAAHIDTDIDDSEAPEMDVAADDLPAFLTEDEPDGVALNGASVP